MAELGVSPRAKKYIPLSAERLRIPEHPDAEIYVWPDTYTPGNEISLGFLGGRAKKPTWYTSSRSIQERDALIQRYLEAFSKKKEEAQQKRVENQDTLEKYGIGVGSMLVAKWGYDQTNINFYLVTKVLGSTNAELIELGSKVVRSTTTAEYVVPNLRERSSQKLRRKVLDRGYFKINSSIYAKLWDGVPKAQDAYNAGR